MSSFKHAYKINPTNFFSLPEDKQNLMSSRFLSLLNSMERAGIVMAKEHVLYNGQKLQVVNTYIASEEPVDSALDSYGFKYHVVSDLPVLKVLKEKAKELIVEYASDNENEDNESESTKLAKCFTIVLLRQTMQPAWVYTLLGLSDMVIIRVKKIETDKAVTVVDRYHKVVKAAGEKRKTMAIKAVKLGILKDALQNQQTSLFKLKLSVVIMANDINELAEKTKKFKKRIRTMEVRFDNTPFRQFDMLPTGLTDDNKPTEEKKEKNGGWWGKELAIDLSGIAILYPFVSSDLLEVDNGILLAVNSETGAPVVYDYQMRNNYNCIFLATSGSGKSASAKVMLKRLLTKYENALTYVIDPQGEYERIADYLGLNVIKFMDNAGNINRLGLDPYRFFGRYEVPEIINQMVNPPDTIRNEITSKAPEASSIRSLYDLLDENSRPFLVHLVNEPFKSLFESDGAEKPITAKTIVSLEGTFGSEERKSLLLLLTLAKTWKEISNAPLQTPKILLVDEGWMLFKIPYAADFVETIARAGRKLNVFFIFISQRPHDFITNEKGRAILENADTKILMKNDESAATEIAKALRLSEHEQDILPNFLPGEALLLTGDHRLRVKFVPTEEELKTFSTTPHGK